MLLGTSRSQLASYRCWRNFRRKGHLSLFPVVRAQGCWWVSSGLHWLFCWYRLGGFHVGPHSPTWKLGSDQPRCPSLRPLLPSPPTQKHHTSKGPCTYWPLVPCGRLWVCRNWAGPEQAVKPYCWRWRHSYHQPCSPYDWALNLLKWNITVRLQMYSTILCISTMA